MKSLPYVEDYLEVISGFRDPHTIKLVVPKWGNGLEKILPAINLARYDVEFIVSVAETTIHGSSMTPKQADLACKIILKYSRQLAKLGIDTSTVETPQFRNSIREIDYTCSLTLHGDRMTVRFPFNDLQVSQFRRFSKESQGSSIWNREHSEWWVDLSEYNVNWVYTWAIHHGFNIDPAVESIYKRIQALEGRPYQIELTITDQRLSITNASERLNQYVIDELGGFAVDNIMKVADYGSVLGFTIEPSIQTAIQASYGMETFTLISNREIRLSSVDQVETVLEYADLVQRWPVVIYEPTDLGTDSLWLILERRYGKSPNLVGTWHDDTTDQSWPITAETKYIFTRKAIRSMDHIAMLISSEGMLIKQDRELMLQHAEKIVFLAAGVYTKKYPNKKVRHIGS